MHCSDVTEKLLQETGMVVNILLCHAWPLLNGVESNNGVASCLFVDLLTAMRALQCGRKLFIVFQKAQQPRVPLAAHAWLAN